MNPQPQGIELILHLLKFNLLKFNLGYHKLVN